MKKIVVWYNPNKNAYYHKIIKSLFYEGYSYEIGSVNQYGHTIIDIIPFDWEYHESIKRHVVNKAISFLKKL